MNNDKTKQVTFGEMKRIRAFLLKGHVLEVFKEYHKNTVEFKQYVVLIDGFFNKGETDKHWINRFIENTFDFYKVPVNKGDLL